MRGHDNREICPAIYNLSVAPRRIQDLCHRADRGPNDKGGHEGRPADQTPPAAMPSADTDPLRIQSRTSLRGSGSALRCSCERPPVLQAGDMERRNSPGNVTVRKYSWTV